MLEWAMRADGWASFGILAAFEVVLSIDNIIVMAVIVALLPDAMAKRALFIGLLIALLLRVALVLGFGRLMGDEVPLFTAFNHGWTWRDCIVFLGGMFLIAKASHELHVQMELPDEDEEGALQPRRFGLAIVQIAFINLAFSIDSMMLAFGVATDLAVMIGALVLGMLVVYVATDRISGYIDRHPTTKTLALALLILIGFLLCIKATGIDVPASYLYAAIVFAAAIELINQWIGKRRPTTDVKDLP
jgi:predicted tellurium resistance membrane protein TerC